MAQAATASIRAIGSSESLILVTHPSHSSESLIPVASDNPSRCAETEPGGLLASFRVPAQRERHLLAAFRDPRLRPSRPPGSPPPPSSRPSCFPFPVPTRSASPLSFLPPSLPLSRSDERPGVRKAGREVALTKGRDERPGRKAGTKGRAYACLCVQSW